MAKIGAVGELGDGVDTSVPGVEASDLNDGDILARTREEVNDRGMLRFIYIPEDGSDNITSDWIQQEHKQKSVWQWVEGVKANIIARGQTLLQEAKDKAQEERARRIRAEQMEDPNEPDGAEGMPENSVRPGRAANPGRHQQAPARRVRDVAPSMGDDPSSYVSEQLELALERLAAAEEAQRDITREVLGARRDADKWRKLAAALDSGLGNSGGDDTGVLVVPARAVTGLSGLSAGGGGHEYLPNQRPVRNNTRGRDSRVESNFKFPDTLPIT